jgi:hypothetical protein
LYEFALQAAGTSSHDWRCIGDLDVRSWREVGNTLGGFDLNLETVEVLDNRGDVHL